MDMDKDMNIDMDIGMDLVFDLDFDLTLRIDPWTLGLGLELAVALSNKTLKALRKRQLFSARIKSGKNKLLKERAL
jgi:hypothetical protein